MSAVVIDIPFVSPKNEQLWNKAIEIHSGQFYGEHPYEYHLNKVRKVLHRFGFLTEDLEQGAMFHDGLEDQGKRVNESLMYSWGVSPKAIDMVQRVSDVNIPNATRSEKKALTYPKIRASKDAIILKLGDRIANVEEATAHSPKKLSMYVKEHNKFRKALFNSEHEDLAPMWKHLDSLLTPTISR